MTIIEVGANKGDDTLRFLERRAKVYAFEPNQILIDNYLNAIQVNYPSLEIIKKAASNFNGTAIFNVDDLGDHGCSSLKEFSDNLDITWPGRTDFGVTSKIEVEVTTLKKFIEENNIEQVDYLHIDAQGADLDVLLGLEDKISIVISGVVEAPIKKEVALYKDQHTTEDVLNFLNKNGFVVDAISQQMNEHNIHFKRP